MNEIIIGVPYKIVYGQEVFAGTCIYNKDKIVLYNSGLNHYYECLESECISIDYTQLYEITEKNIAKKVCKQYSGDDNKEYIKKYIQLSKEGLI